MIEDLLDRYSICRELGAGTVARTFLGKQHGDAGLQRFVVIKQIHQRVCERPGQLERVLEGGRALAAIHHHNLVSVIDQRQDQGQALLVCDYVPGESVLSILSRCTQLQRHPPLGIALRVLADACAGVQSLHGDAGELLHGAIRPANVLVSYVGRTAVADGGVGAVASELAADGQLTTGIAQFVAPEALEGGQAGPAADVYSLAVVLYVLLTLRFPFDENELGALAEAKRRGAGIPAAQRSPDLPEELDHLLSLAISPSPDERPQTAEALGEQLERQIRARALPADQRLIEDWVGSIFGSYVQAKQGALRQLLSAPRAFEDTAADTSRISSLFSSTTTIERAPAWLGEQRTAISLQDERERTPSPAPEPAFGGGEGPLPEGDTLVNPPWPGMDVPTSPYEDEEKTDVGSKPDPNSNR